MILQPYLHPPALISNLRSIFLPFPVHFQVDDSQAFSWESILTSNIPQVLTYILGPHMSLLWTQHSQAASLVGFSALTEELSDDSFFSHFCFLLFFSSLSLLFLNACLFSSFSSHSLPINNHFEEARI